MTDSPLQIGPFEIAEQLGEGGMGSVFRATHHQTSVDVALKLVKAQGSETFHRQFHREVQAHAGLVHPGIVYLFDYGEIDEEAAEATGDELTAGSPWVAMELADRGTVRDLMPMSGWHEVRPILVQILDALAYAHARRVAHRDLKPENLLVFDTEEDLRVKLADFGIAHALEDLEDRDTDELRTPAGTPLYMAPEQIRGRWRDHGPWTDLYALGCIAFELVCGRPPFEAAHSVGVTVQHCTDDRPELEPRFEVPDRLQDWIQRLMAVNYRDRFGRSADAARALPVGTDLEDTSSTNTGDLETMETIPTDEARTEPVPTEIVTLPATELSTEFAETEIAETTTGSSPTGEAGGRSGSGPQDDGSAGAARDTESSEPMQPAPVIERTRSLADWRRPESTEPPRPMVGTGLGLFGLRESPFVDRDEQRDVIWQSLREVVDQDAFRLVLISGPSGIGKTALARWIIRRTDELAAANVIRTHYSPGPGDRTEGFSGMLLQMIGGWRLDRDELYQKFVDRLPPLQSEPEFREHDALALTEMVAPTDRSDPEVDGPRYNFDAPRSRLVLMSRLLRRVDAGGTPLMWVDDLQWGAESIALFRYLTEQPDPPRGLVIATVQSEAVGGDSILDERLASLNEARYSKQIDLEPLESRYQRRLLDRVLPLESSLADRITARTQGNPLFARQLVQTLVDSGGLRATRRGYRLDEETTFQWPSDSRELWSRRLDQIFDDFRRRDDAEQAVELAALLGRSVEGDEWRTVCDNADLRVPSNLIDRLVEGGLVDRHRNYWLFTHQTIVETLEHRAREAQRLHRHHRQIARMLESREADRGKQAPMRRLKHWLEANRPDRAIDAVEQASERLEDAGRQVRRRLLDLWEQLLEQLDSEPTDRLQLEHDFFVAIDRFRRGDADGCAELLYRLLRRCRHVDNLGVAVRCHRRLGVYYRTAGDRESATDHFEQALRVARRADCDELQGRVRLSMGWTAVVSGDVESARKHTRRALELFDEHQTYLRTRARLHLGWIALNEGDFEAAESLFSSVIEVANQAGFGPIERQAAAGFGDVARYGANYEQARRMYHRQLELSRQLGRHAGGFSARLNLVQTELAAGRIEEATDQMDAARQYPDDLVETAQFGSFFDSARLALAAARGHWTNFDEIITCRHRDDWAQQGSVTRDIPSNVETAADHALDDGQIDRARTALTAARDLWAQLDDEAAERVENRLASLSSTSPEETDR